MISEILRLDTELLIFINSHHTSWLDTLMWYASQAWVWIPLYILLAAYFYYLHSETDRQNSKIISTLIIVLAVGAAAGLSDYVTSGILKHLIARPRPTHTDGVGELLHIINGYRGGQYGFPSSHAANCWAVCITSLLIINEKLKIKNEEKISLTVRHISYITIAVLLFYALINCYSRMYLGVHFPLDILCGSIIGCIIGCLLFLLWRWATSKLFTPHHFSLTDTQRK